jgi:hypothetical protein
MSRYSVLRNRASDNPLIEARCGSTGPFAQASAEIAASDDDVAGIVNGGFAEGAKGGLSARENGPKSPVDLPLRLDDANASPTTPQGQRQ